MKSAVNRLFKRNHWVVDKKALVGVAPNFAEFLTFIMIIKILLRIIVLGNHGSIISIN